MPLPSNFDENKHFFDTLLKTHNKEVREYFKKTPDNDVSTEKGSLKHACLIKETDSQNLAMDRVYFFDVKIGGLKQAQIPVYGIPVEDYQRDIKFRPQIKLWFSSDPTLEDMSKHQTEITFRLVNESSESINRDKAVILAKAIKTHFATPDRFKWNKGIYKYTYLDQEKGYDLRLLVVSKEEGKKVVEKILAIQGHTFENEYAQFIHHEKTYLNDPGTHMVYGKQVKKYRKRPTAQVFFRYAQLMIWGRTTPINLVAGWDSRLDQVIEKI